MASTSPLVPTFIGHIASTQDALLLFEACLSGALNHVARRPHDRERMSLIKSGNVFIYEEHSSGIKRWTDGVPWSPSRILGNFLVYRELERPFPPGEKKRAMKRSKRSPGITKQESFSPNNGIGTGYNITSSNSSFDSPSQNSLSKETERSLIGSLVDSYGFKDEGLVKKTVSVNVGGIHHHLVSYYAVADVMNNKFTTPSKDPRFQYITPRPDLITKQNFRTPIDEVDPMDRMDERSVYAGYSYPTRGYEMTNQAIAHRPMPLPTPPMAYTSNPNLYNNYSMNTHSAGYDSLGQTTPNSAYNTQFAPSHGIYPAPKQEQQNYEMGAGYRQRYSSVIRVGSDNRSQMPAAAFEQPELSGMSTTSSDSKLTNDSGYASQGYYSTAPSQHTYATHRSLPTPPTQQESYGRGGQPYHGFDGGARENMWSMGSSGSPHGHYMTPQQWASSGTS